MADISSFVNQYQGVAQKVGAALGVDPNILLGQWGLESGWGKHTVPGTNNLGNIKGAGPAATDNMTGSRDTYRQYGSAQDFGNDYARLIATNYPDATGAGDDALAYAMALKGGGYAEDPHYASKVTAAVDTVRQNGGAIDPSKVQWDDGGAAAPAQIDTSKVQWDDAQSPAAPAKTATAAAPSPAPAKPKTAREKAADLLTNGPTDQLTAGILHGVTNTVGGAIQHGAHGLGWLLNKAGFPNADQAVTGAGDKAAQFLQEGTPNTPIGMAGQVIGGGALPVGGASLPSTVAGAAALGALQPVQPGQDFGQQTLKNGLIGGGLGLAGGVASRLVRGATPEAQALIDAGVNVTPGQGYGGLARNIEEYARSIPVLGNAIGSAERSNVASYNRMLYQDALAPIGATLPRNVATGSDAVAHVRETIGQQFNRLSQNASFTPRGQFLRDLGNIRNDLAQRAPAAIDQFDNIVDNQIAQKLNPQRTMSGTQWNDSRSFISQISRENRMGDTNATQRALADAMDDLNEAMNSQVARQSTNPDFRQDLTNANNAYTRYKRIETASGSGGASNNGNVFSAAQYANAVRQGSTKFQRATNSGLNAEVAARAQQVLGSKVPDSGTAGRLFLGGAALGASAIHPGTAAGIGAGSLLYGTPAGRRALQLLLLQRPELLRAIGGGMVGAAPGAGVLAPQLQLPQAGQ